MGACRAQILSSDIRQVNKHHLLRLQDLIAHDAPKRHKISVHITSTVDQSSNDVVVTEQMETGDVMDGLNDVPKLKEVNNK